MEFENLEELKADPFFMFEVESLTEEMIKKRKNRPSPPVGGKYRRDLFDLVSSHCMDSELHPNFFMENFEAVTTKKSNLPTRVRAVVVDVFNESLKRTLIRYENAKTPIES